MELRRARARPGAQLRREAALHVRRPVQHPDRLPRTQRRRAAALGAALAGVRVVARAHPRPQGRLAGDAVRREGPAQERDPRRQPGVLPRGRDALQHQGRGARGGVSHSDRQGGPEARGRSLLDHRVRQDGARGDAGGRPAREGRHQRRRRRSAHDASDGRRRDQGVRRKDESRRRARGRLGDLRDRNAGGRLHPARLLRLRSMRR